MKAPEVNPVLERELRQRLRGRAAWVALTLYLLVLASILRLVYDVVSHSETVIGSQAQAASAAGRSIFHWLLFVMLALICFIVPGLTAGAIASERERQTLVPLQITLLGARSIVVGKLLASLAFVVLLVIAALPFLSVSFLLGGVSVLEVAKGLSMLLVVAVAVAALSLACSSGARRTQTATVTAYGIVAVLVIGTFVTYGAQRALDRSPAGSTKPAILVINPFAATAEVVRGRAGAESDRGLTSPFQPLQSLLSDDVFSDDTISGNSGFFIQEGVPPLPPAPEPPPIISPAPATAVATAPGVAIAPAQGAGPTEVPVGPVVTVEGRAFAQVPPQRVEVFRPDGRPRVGGIPFWTASLLSFSLIAVGSMLIAVRRVTVPTRRREE